MAGRDGQWRHRCDHRPAIAIFRRHCATRGRCRARHSVRARRKLRARFRAASNRFVPRPPVRRSRREAGCLRDARAEAAAGWEKRRRDDTGPDGIRLCVPALLNSGAWRRSRGHPLGWCGRHRSARFLFAPEPGAVWPASERACRRFRPGKACRHAPVRTCPHAV